MTEYSANDFMYYRESSLYHYGVKGMKWGVRRYQNYDGTLKNTRKNEHSKEKLKKAAIIASSAVGIAATAYFLKQYGDRNLSKTLKVGTDIQHMSRIVNEHLDKPFYASYLKSDNKKYSSNYFDFMPKWTTEMHLKNNSKIKIAGNKTAEKIFKEWTKKDKAVGSKYLNMSYRTFNKNLNSPDIRDQASYKSFYDELKKKGFSAIRDLNDQENKIKSPIIIFNNFDNLESTYRKYHKIT